jgi:hypothetical protein
MSAFMLHAGIRQIGKMGFQARQHYPLSFIGLSILRDYSPILSHALGVEY